jgi:myo-inositol-1(or 4)-monophosphatase
VLEKVAREAGSVALNHFRNLKYLEVYKKLRDFVTVANVAGEVF